MVKVKFKKAAVVALAGAMVLSTSLTGCSGKKKVDYNAGNEGSTAEGEENNGGTTSNREGIAGKLGIPDSIDETFDVGASGLSKIEAFDDEIDAPTTQSMNVIHFTPATMTNDDKKQICEKIFDKGEPIYLYDYDNLPKEVIQKEIDGYKESLEQAKKDGDTYYQQDLEDWIKEAEDRLAKAPDTYPEAGDYSGGSFMGVYDGTQYMLSAYSNTGDDSSGFSTGASYYLSIEDYSELIKVRPYDGASECYITEYGDMDTEGVDNASTMTTEQAENVAYNFFADLGYTDIDVKSTSNLYWVYEGKNYETLSNEADGYTVTFNRKIEGVAPYSIDYYNLPFMQTINNGWVSSVYESFQAYVYDGKVLGASWSVLYNKPDNVEENVDLLSYDEIMKVANESFCIYFAENKSKYKKVEFNDVRLSYFLVSDGKNKCKYIPAYIFAEYEELVNEDGSKQPQQLFVFNAMDGTLIDLLEDAKEMGTFYTWDNEGNMRYEDSEIIEGSDDDTDSDSEGDSEGDTTEADDSSEDDSQPKG